jgi:hypothetical protein
MKTFKTFLQEAQAKPSLVISIDAKGKADSYKKKLLAYLNNQGRFKFEKATIDPASDNDELIVKVYGDLNLPTSDSAKALKSIKDDIKSDLEHETHEKVSVASVVH